MSKLKFVSVVCVIAFAFTSAQTQAFKTEEVLIAFSGLTLCDGSKKAEEVCKQYCKGDSFLKEKACSNQAIWDNCRTICRQDWIEDCITTAKKHNLEGLPRCQ